MLNQNQEQALEKLSQLWLPITFQGFIDNSKAILALIGDHEQSTKDILIKTLFEKCPSFVDDKDSDVFIQLFSEMTMVSRSEIAARYNLHEYFVHCDNPSHSRYSYYYNSEGQTVFYDNNQKTGFVELSKNGNTMEHSLTLRLGDEKLVCLKFSDFNDAKNQLANSAAGKRLTEYSLNNIYKILNSAERNSHFRSVHSRNIAEIAALLPKVERVQFANKHLQTFSQYTNFDVSYFLPFLSSEEQLTFVGQHQNTISHGRDLKPILAELSPENRFTFLNPYTAKINDPSESEFCGISVYESIKLLTQTEADFIAERCIDKVRNCKELAQVLACLSPEKRRGYAETFCDKYHHVIHDNSELDAYSTIDQYLVKIMSQLLEIDRFDFLEHIFSHLNKNSLAQNLDEYLTLLPVDKRKDWLDKHSELIFAPLMKEKRPEWLHWDISITKKLLALLSPEDQVLFKNKYESTFPPLFAKDTLPRTSRNGIFGANENKIFSSTQNQPQPASRSLSGT